MRNFATLLLLLYCFITEAQIAEPNFIHYGVEEGVPSSETYMVIQDKKGYMWFATDRGVARFDGHKFQTFTTKDGLCDNSVLGLHEDHHGRIWFFTFSNQLSYYENGKIHNHFANDTLKRVTEFRVPCSMIVDSSNVIWMGFRANYFGRHFLKIYPDGKLESVNSMGQEKGLLAVVKQFSSGEYLWSFRTKNDVSVFSFQNHGQPPTFYKDSSYHQLRFNLRRGGFSFYQTTDHEFLFTYLGSLYEQKDGEVQFKARMKYSTTFGLLKDAMENIWVATFSEGIMVYRKDKYDQPINYLLKDKVVSWITEDDEGGIWLTTLNDGIFYAPSIEFLTINSVNYFNNRRILNMAGNQQSLYFGTYQGEIFEMEYNRDLEFKVKTKYKFQRTSNVTSIAEFPDYVFGSGMYSDGSVETKVWHKGIEKMSLKQFHDPISKNAKDELVISDKKGLYSYNLETNQYNLLLKFPRSRSFKCMKLNSNRNIWLGTTDGLIYYNGDKFITPPHQNHLLDLRVNGLGRFGDKMLLGTLGGGLIIHGGDSIWQITAKDGLASDLCNSVLVDKDNIIWVSTNRGISKVTMKDSDAKKWSIINYSHYNGLLSDEVNKILIQDSLVWVQCDKGLSVFNKYKTEKNNQKPRVYIQRFSVNYKDTSVLNSYELKHEQNNIEIAFAGISYRTGDRLQYKYRLLGLDSKWQYTDQTSLVYPKLPPGKYKFDVLAKDYRGIWSTNNAGIQFTIKQPFWNSWWFIIACIVVFAGILQIAVLIRFRVLRNRALLLQRSFESEQKALQSQLNPHFIFNTLGSIQELISSKRYGLANQNLSNVARLIRKILNNSRNQFVSLNDEIESLETYLNLEELRFGENMTWEITVDPILDQEMTYIPPMLLQPFVENAIWHGLQQKEDKSGRINIEFAPQNEWICCSITDNGVGREKSAKLRGKYNHEPLGMKIVEERIQLLNMNRKVPFKVEIIDLKDNNGMASGTSVIIYLSLE